MPATYSIYRCLVRFLTERPNTKTVSSIVAMSIWFATPSLANEIDTKAKFLAEVAGRKLVEGKAWVIVAPGGSVEGQGPKGGKIEGHWDWDGKYYCREITIDGVHFPRDCQSVTRNGKDVGFTHKEGKGVTVNWRIE